MKTDNDTIKALERCGGNTMNDCDNCPRCYDDGLTTAECMCKLICDALNLINRQKAEIERLKGSRDTIVKMKQCIGVKKEVEADAVKKFTDKLFNELAGYENMFDELQDWSARNTVLQLTHALKKLVDNDEKYEKVSD